MSFKEFVKQKVEQFKEYNKPENVKQRLELQLQQEKQQLENEEIRTEIDQTKKKQKELRKKRSEATIKKWNLDSFGQSFYDNNNEEKKVKVKFGI